MSFADELFHAESGKVPMPLARIEPRMAVQPVYAIRQVQVDALLDEIRTLRQATVSTAAPWQKLDWEDEATRPTKPGTYAVMVEGDSESIDGRTIYEYPDYQTFATLTGPDEDGAQSLTGFHDEEAEFMIAWYGPIDVPPCDCLGG